MITKLHLAGGVDFDWDRVTRNIQAVRPGRSGSRVSAKTGEARAEYIGLPESRLAEAHVGAATAAAWVP
jgi:Ni2+-binding GTPase involved in maturation of urease and hydrogenase